MIYFGYPLDIHGSKPKPETEPEIKPKPELENRGRKPTPNPKPEKPKPADTRTEFDPLPSLVPRNTKHNLTQLLRNKSILNHELFQKHTEYTDVAFYLVGIPGCHL